MMRPGFKKQRMKNFVFKMLVIVLSCMVIIPLILILYHITMNGIRVINWEFLSSMPRPVAGEASGGVLNAIIGTVMIVFVALLLSAFIGIGAGIYLSEERRSGLSYWIRLCSEILQGVPSIVIGIAAYVWIVVRTGSFSAFSGSIALAMMMLPVIVRSTEETLRLIPVEIKEAAFALGAPRYRTIMKVVLPTGLSGITTGILLSVARVAGETAPLLFTAFGSPYLNFNILKPMSALPLSIYYYATSPFEQWHALAWGGSFVLVVMVLILNMISKAVIKKWKVQF
jgi:phosphate transport system permease protein